MKIGIVFHGPEVIDSGYAQTILEKLAIYGNITAMLGGTMGKTAVMDAGLNGVIDIQCNLKPSKLVEQLMHKCDIVFLINHGKNLLNGRRFASIVAGNILTLDMKPFIHVERPGCSDEEMFPCNQKAVPHVRYFSKILGIKPSGNEFYASSIEVETNGSYCVRYLSGVKAGENIFINGIIVGKALTDNVSVVFKNGMLFSIDGGRLKDHGAEKLHGYEQKIPLDLKKAWIKSGKLRDRKPYAVNWDNNFRRNNISGTRTALIDHDAENTFEYIFGSEPISDSAITIGDDTTAIAGNILHRFSIPLIGIVDGDQDCEGFMNDLYPSSTVIIVKQGNDDIIGRQIKKSLFKHTNYSRFQDFESLKHKVICMAHDSIERVINY
ncbi:conserved hypothetical protein [Methanosalsum zhilinae DSM 4017]|uniref:DUF2117 domain-containing protein n=1 Tax=Methanosalsum zhilinae (strain DSM 4017 / NBRC 107636 / OCM 62 / WeN5) TaxID=679901 RepID=F7XL08_METZD|nr:DUF2117 domain-containing protein [Methanosalsum zhilinae]AEH60711.1 conserved hypothetical protein [Methanosalsum zhilinae DSM 4017]